MKIDDDFFLDDEDDDDLSGFPLYPASDDIDPEDISKIKKEFDTSSDDDWSDKRYDKDDVADLDDDEDDDY